MFAEAVIAEAHEDIKCHSTKISAPKFWDISRGGVRLGMVHLPIVLFPEISQQNCSADKRHLGSVVAWLATCSKISMQRWGYTRSCLLYF